MRKIILIALSAIILVGCGLGTKKQMIDEMKDGILENLEVVDYEEEISYSDEDVLKGYILKGKNSLGEENLYIVDGLKGTGNGIFKTGKYHGQQLFPEEKFYYQIHSTKDCGQEYNYFIGIIYDELSTVFYKDDELEIQSKQINLQGEEINLNFWLMKYLENEEIDLNEFSYR